MTTSEAHTIEAPEAIDIAVALLLELAERGILRRQRATTRRVLREVARVLEALPAHYPERGPA